MSLERKTDTTVSDAQRTTSIVRLTVPTEEFVLQETLQALPDVTFTCEQVVTSGTVLPLIWARGEERSDLEVALANDSSVRNATLFAEFQDKWLYQIEWDNSVRLLVEMITNSRGTILDAHSGNDEWQLRVLYPDRGECSEVHEFCANHGLTIDIQSIQKMDEAPSGRYGLTSGQFEALVLATRRGFFDVPRSTTLEDLATECGISHQALSERLRRAVEALVRATLMVDAPAAPGETEPR